MKHKRWSETFFLLWRISFDHARNRLIFKQIISKMIGVNINILRNCIKVIIIRNIVLVQNHADNVVTATGNSELNHR